MDAHIRDQAVQHLIALGVAAPDAINVCSMLEAVAEILKDKGMAVALVRSDDYTEAEIHSAMAEAEAMRKFGLMQ